VVLRDVIDPDPVMDPDPMIEDRRLLRVEPTSLNNVGHFYFKVEAKYDELQNCCDCSPE
jgi:hypothetical protein